jgi:hypothetical protein
MAKADVTPTNSKKQDFSSLEPIDRELNLLCRWMESNINVKGFTPQAVVPPRTMREAFKLDYNYQGGDCFTDGRFLPRNDNTMNWEGEMEWFLDRHDESGCLPRVIRTRTRARFEFCEIIPDSK